MEYQIVFSNGEKIPFTVHHSNNLYGCEILKLNSTDFYNSGSDYSFASQTTFEIIEAKENSLELLLNTIKKKIEEMKKPELTFEIIKK